MPVILTKNHRSSVTDIDEEVHRRLKRGETQSFIYIAPTKRKVRALQREFLSHTPGMVAPQFFLYTLETLASTLHSLMCEPKKFIAGAVQAVVMDEAISSVEDSLQYFRLRGGHRKIPAGTLEKIINVVNALKERGVYRATLYAEVETADLDEKAKLKDILTIYDAYETMMGVTFVDAAGMMKELNERWSVTHAAAHVKPHFDRVDTIFVSGFDEFSDPELTLLHNLSAMPGIGMLVSFDYHLENDEVFGHLKENYRKFLDMEFKLVRTRPLKRASFAQHVSDTLFQYDVNDPAIPCKDSVTILDAEDRQGEVELIAKLIKKLTNDHPQRDLGKICVAMYRPQLYTSLFREIFAQYGIPSNITDRFHLDQSPLIVSILALLSVQQRQYRLTDIMRALSSPYFEFTQGEGDIAAGGLYEVATQLRISGGLNVWFHRIAERRAWIAKELLEVDDDLEADRLHREDRLLDKACQDLNALTKLLACFDAEMTPLEFKERLISLLKDLRVAERILAVHSSAVNDDLREKDARAYQRFLSFLNEFLEILAFQQKAASRERLPFYVEKLKTAIAQVRYNVRQRYGYGVVVTSLDETRGLHFDIMIIAGMVDGEFPPVYQPEILFSAARRAHVERYHLHEHRYLFYQALTNFKEHLYLTFPRGDDEIELVPSSFLDALVKVAEVEDFRKTVSPEISETIGSEDEFLQYAGECMGAAIDHHRDHARPSMPDVRAELHATLDHLHHAIAVERSRLSGHSFPEYNGNIFSHLSPGARDALEQFRKRVFSVTQLESYGSCPFQFFSNKILRLTSISEFDEGISPLERGGLLHDILFEFYITRRQKKFSMIRECTETEFQTAVDDLNSLARRKLEELHIPDVFWDIDKEFILGSQTRKGMLREFLDLERSSTVDVEPKYFEVAFGSRVGGKRKTDESLSSEIPIDAGNVKLRGKVDRIDVGQGAFKIIDYKTGSNLAGRNEIDLGMSLQLPIYLYAVEKLFAFRANQKLRGGAGTYIRLKSPVKEQLGIGSAEHRETMFTSRSNSRQLVATDEELRDIIDQAIRFVNEYVDGIARGKFPVEPKKPEKICTYCEYKSICRIQSKIAVPEIGMNTSTDDLS